MSDAWEEMKIRNKSLLKQFVTEMKEAGAIGSIKVSFNGHGDSGDVEKPELTPEQKAIVEKLGYEFEYGGGWRYVDGKYVEIAPDIKKTLLSIISKAIPFDYVNNEGGYGSVYLDIDATTVRIEGYERIEIVENVNYEF